MGASGWHYRTAWHEDVAAAVEALQRQVFDAGEYYWPHDGRDLPARPLPSSVEELWRDELVQHTGTHCILDVDTVIASTDADDTGTVRALTADEVRSFFGTCTPTAEDADRAEGRGRHGVANGMPNWSAWCTPLYADGHPVQLAFWGFSGD